MIETIFEDDDLLIVDKPAGLPTLRSKDPSSPSLAAEIIGTHPNLDGLPECGIAHRLDNDTSGIVCVGKTVHAYESLRHQFADGSVEKTYLALVMGSPPHEGRIDAPIAHHPRKRRKMVVCESEERSRELKGRPAVSLYMVADRYERYTMLRVTIETGIRHQIRAHLSWAGFPVAGDRLYQNSKMRADDALPLRHHFLHAARIAMKHPTTGNHLSFECPLPSNLVAMLAKMQKID